MKYFWDTNLLLPFQAKHPVLQQHIARVSWDEIALPSIVVAEALRGRCETVLKATPEQAPFANQKLIETYDLLQDFNMVTFDKKAAKELTRLKSTKKSKWGYADMMIAAMALAEGAIVVTRNTRHFKDLLPKKQLANWIDIRGADSPRGFFA
jgi:tRNA(fMet)-specific endonuclease VapC